jgi:predicted GNAT family acetyltransferase
MTEVAERPCRRNQLHEGLPWHHLPWRPMAAPTAETIRVLDVPEHFRFEIRVDGELAGFTEYRRRPGLIAFTHTLIDPRFEGQGLASRLVQTALSEAHSEGLAVLPFCPFVCGYIARHSEEYLDLVPGDLRDAFELSADA